jgi:hypothetical protein
MLSLKQRNTTSTSLVLLAVICSCLVQDGRAAESTHTGSLRATNKDEPRLQFRRDLLRDVRPQHFFALSDPRTEQLKKEGLIASDAAPSIPAALSKREMPRPLNILSFGTSQTYGHGLEDRANSYPYLITPYPDNVDNLALPATAADHPSICLESMIPMADKKNYDLILLEYPSNQSDGVRLLLQRLRERYPSAVIMWVHVWHYVGRARVAGTNNGATKVGYDPTLEWEWKQGDSFSSNPDETRDCIREICHLKEMLALLDEVGAVPYMMEQTKTPQEIMAEGWFAEDWHHLSQQGHKNVADEIAQLLRTQYKGTDLWTQVFMQPKKLGSWALGDTCFNWHYSGDVQVQYSGAELTCHMEQDPISCTLDMDATSGGTITFESDYEGDVPFAIGYITKGFPAIFPTVMVQVNDHDAFRVNPNIDRATRVNSNSGSMVTSYIQAGYATHGSNTIHITPTEVTEKPFQLIGIYLCGACRHYQRDHMGLGALNMDNHGNAQTYDKNRLKNIMRNP